MKAMMSEKLRNMLNNPVDARELQRQLSMSRASIEIEKSNVSDAKNIFYDDLT
jgi:hypothetical protein